MYAGVGGCGVVCLCIRSKVASFLLSRMLRDLQSSLG